MNLVMLQPHVHALQLAQQWRAMEGVFVLEVCGASYRGEMPAQQIPLHAPHGDEPHIPQSHAQRRAMPGFGEWL